MKYLPLIVLTAAISACAGQPPARTQSVGQSQQPPTVVAQCVARTWADKTQQQVVSQNILANGQAVDVYVPGQNPPDGAAAVVRPSNQGSGSWVGFRASSAAGGDAAGDIRACL